MGVAYLLAILMVLTAIFLILLILVQRGRGGGLAGALGGMGGQSAFGTKAGDLFTRITIGAAAFWIVLCIVSVKLMSGSGNRLNVNTATTTNEMEAAPKSDDKASSGKEAATGAEAETKGTSAASPTTNNSEATNPAPAPAASDEKK